ncbi:MAG: long-chain-fatty-acid--CoA ligase [Legionellales bacterium]|nr:long-chain-fatty-acid--CoA ligase [Legionellales bacterium]|tara:strand:- start:4612 stop:6225 length:1614 start_codon:yes stop_codon:yes gene_type:complete
MTLNIKRFSDLNALLQDSCQQYSRRAFSSHMGTTITYRQLYTQSEYFARVLQHQFSVKPGDRVAIMLPNTFQHHMAFFGCILAGAVVVCVNPLYTPRELNHQLNDSGAKLLVGLDVFGDVVQQGIENTLVDNVIMCSMGDCLGLKGFLVNIIIKYFKKKVPRYRINSAYAFKSLMKSRVGPLVTLLDRSSERIALLQYTGGTTGLSKGVMLSHQNILSNIEQCASVSQYLDKRDGPRRVLCALPLFHIYALTSIFLLSLRRGDQLILVHSPRDISSLIAIMIEYRPQIIPLINTLFAQLIRHKAFDDFDFSDVDYCLSGGMAQQLQVSQQWYDKTKTVIHQGYGLSETSPVVSICLENKVVDNVGVPLPMTKIGIRHVQTGAWLKTGESGEICIKGPQVMVGYWNRPQETAAIFEDGWLKTGDIGCLNEQGQLVINDRLKDMAIINGFNVYPNEVESVLVGYSHIEEAAVVGMVDQSGKEYLVAYIVQTGSGLTVREVLDYCKENLVYYKIPRLVSFVDSLPKTAVGKVCRKRLRQA